MDTVSTPANVEVDPSWNINYLLTRRLGKEPDATAIERQQADGTWLPMSVKEFNCDVIAVAKGLVALGIAPGDHVA
ncbi:MAG: long-chain fatty acid--CoA ligase, partial [Bifidobacteriaceae bacterium]|nr:long-chain fatty acid--CoA ligase [Bifidobacteriaceae bacterium]